MPVLIVDDNRDAAVSPGMVLKALGAEVQLAHEGRTAIDIFDAVNPSAVLLDIGMPEMDGYAVASPLRARYPEHHCKIVALTGWGQEEDRQRAREAGIDHHLIKPVQIEVLQELLGQIAHTQTL